MFFNEANLFSKSISGFHYALPAISVFAEFPLEDNVCVLIRVLPFLCQLSFSLTMSFICKSEWHELVNIKLALESWFQTK